MIKLYSKDDFEKMLVAGQIAAEVLDYITDFVRPGVTTLELNDLCQKKMDEIGVKSACLGYKGFPKSVCISPNHVICHGIPGEKKLVEGDIINIDVTIIKDGWFGDTSRMYFVGDKIPIKAKLLCNVTYECMMLGIDAIRPGKNLNVIGKAIEDHAHKNGFSVVRDFCGHGIGQVFHQDPNVLHYYDPNCDIVIEEGMIFTVEPMINAGKYHAKVLADGWTAVTKDKSLSAQFEHTIGVGKNGAEIFTKSLKGYKKPPY